MTRFAQNIPPGLAGLELRGTREPLGEFDADLFRDVVHPDFLLRTVDLINAVEGQLARTEDESLMGTLIRIRYQLCLEYMQAFIEHDFRTRSVDPAAAVAAFELSTDPTANRSSWVMNPDGTSFRDEYGRIIRPRIPDAVRGRLPKLSLVTQIYSLSGEPFPSSLSESERSLMAEFYHPTSTPGVLSLKNRDLLTRNPVLTPEIEALVDQLAVRGGRDFAKVNKRFAGRMPYSSGPLTISNRDGAFWSYARHPQFRIPYGALPYSREFLLHMQHEVARGRYAGHTVQIAGRVDPRLLAWASSKGIDHLGPIPDIELVYVHPLPSRRLYSFVIKAARNYSQKPRIDRDSLTPEDRAFASLIERFFDDPFNKTSWNLLSQLRASDFSENLRLLVNAPWKIASLDEFQEMRVAWLGSVSAQLNEHAIYTPQKTTNDWISNPDLVDEQAFTSLVAERLSKLPEEQPYYPPEFVRLVPGERETFMREQVPELFAICQGERQRVATELTNGRHQARLRLGYFGPEGGYPLPLDYMLLDKIVNLRRRQTYQMRESARLGVPVNSVPVPPTVGRSYAQPERFFSLADIPVRLAQTKAEPTVVAEIFDPLSESGKSELTGETAIRSMAEKMEIENLKRLSPLLAPKIRNLYRSMKAEPHPSQALENAHRFRSTHRIHRRLLRQAELAISELTREKGASISTLQKSLKSRLRRGEITGPLMAEQLEVAKAAFDTRIAREQHKLRMTRRALLLMYENFAPTIVRENCMKFLSITDQHIVKFTYSVPAEPKVILDEEQIRQEAIVRRTHSEQLGGRNMYAGGELIFARWQATFTNYTEWMHFKVNLPTDSPWYCLELNNLSGHYQPLATCLKYASGLIGPKLRDLKIDVTRMSIVDRLAPGLRMRGRAYGWYKF